jgi:hypothetical protein
VLDSTVDETGSINFGRAYERDGSPLTTADDLPDEIKEMLLRPSFSNLSSENVKVIKTAFDPENMENKRVNYKDTNRRARFRYTQDQRKDARCARPCKSSDQFIKLVRLYFSKEVYQLMRL